MLDNKRAQIGETMTWVIATIAIIVILILSIFIVSFTKDESKEFKTYRNSDLLAVKSLSGYLLTQDEDGTNIYNQLIIDESLNDFNGNLASQIFKRFYKKDYLHAVWLGFDFEGVKIRKNDYFGSRPSDVRGGDISWKFVSFISEEIYFLNKDKYLRLLLMEK
ncbi:hypothetical protein KAR52_02770 [Candidatus Pacearchaeota archaeon]|nr:hypothetical protein [Candidatus Pacearchaeota archaeon]